MGAQHFPQVTQRLTNKSSPISSAGSPKKVSYLQDGWPIKTEQRGKPPEMDNSEPWLLFKKFPQNILYRTQEYQCNKNSQAYLQYTQVLQHSKATRHAKSRLLPLLSSISPSLECSDWASGGVWSTATLFWFIIFSLSFGFVRFLLGTVTVRLCNWDMPDSVKQTPSWVYVFGGSIKVEWIITAI